MAWAPDYITLDDLKGYLEIPLTDTQDDVELAEDITTASRTVDTTCSGGIRRQFGNTDMVAVARTYRPKHTYLGYLAEIDDLQDLTDLEVDADGTVLTSDQYVLHEENAVADGKPYEWITVATSVVKLTITARWGWTAVPAQVKTSTKLQAAQLFKRRRAPFGLAGTPDLGAGSEPVRLLAITDPHLRVSLKDLIRTEGFA